eukprot:5751040-Amphidinium_carterae.2
MDDVLGGGKGEMFQAAMQKLQGEINFGNWESFAEEREKLRRKIYTSVAKWVHHHFDHEVRTKVAKLDIAREGNKHQNGLSTVWHRRSKRKRTGH